MCANSKRLSEWEKPWQHELACEGGSAIEGGPWKVGAGAQAADERTCVFSGGAGDCGAVLDNIYLNLATPGTRKPQQAASSEAK